MSLHSRKEPDFSFHGILQKNGEKKDENQKATSNRPSENEGDIVDPGLTTEGTCEISNDFIVNKETTNQIPPHAKRKRPLEKIKVNIPKKKRDYVDVEEWLDATSIQSAEELEGIKEEFSVEKEPEATGECADSPKNTSELGKFLHFYRPDDDVKMEMKIETRETDEQSVALPCGGKLADGNSEESPEEIHQESLGKAKKSKKEEKLKKSDGEPCLYRCDHCPKVYPSQGGLSYHRFIYHSAKYTPPVCDICGKTFRIQKYLESHKNTVHFKLKEHLCDLCGKDFSSKYGLKLHKIWHMGTKNFPCDICGMRFSTIGKVNTHKQVHGGPKNYICEVCSRAFRWKKSLFTHMRTHSGERPL